MKYLLVVIAVLLSCFFVYFPITDSDIFWHLAAGREMVARKQFLFTDPFSYTLVSPGWTDLHWLFQLFCYGVYSLGAERALLLFKLAAVGVTVALLCMTFPHKRALVLCALLAPLLVYRVRYLLDIRPVLVTVVFSALYLFLFERTRLSGKHWLLFWCVPLQILWTNCQGLFPVGLFIVGAYCVENIAGFYLKKNGSPVPYAALLTACTASSLVNPWGAGGFLLPLALFSRIVPDAHNIYSLNISENIPLFSASGYDEGYRTLVIIIALAAALLFVLNRKNVRLAHLIIFGGSLFLACCAVRNVLLYCVIVIPIICCQAAALDLWNRPALLTLQKKRRGAAAGVVFAAAILCVPVFRHASAVSLYPRNSMISPFRFPEKITDIIKGNPVPGNMFNDIRYGGYLIWHLYPEKKVFIDTRLIIRPPAFFAEYLAISARPELFPHVAAGFNITHAVLPSAFFTRHMKLIQWLYRSDSWRLEYADGASVLFVRSDIPHGQPLDLSNDTTLVATVQTIGRRYSARPALCREGVAQFAGFLDSLRLFSSASRVRKRFAADGTSLWADESIIFQVHGGDYEKICGSGSHCCGHGSPAVCRGQVRQGKRSVR